MILSNVPICREFKMRPLLWIKFLMRLWIKIGIITLIMHISLQAV